MSDREGNVCAQSARMNKRKKWRKDLEDTLPDLEEAKKSYYDIKIPEELGDRLQRAISLKKKTRI